MPNYRMRTDPGLYQITFGPSTAAYKKNEQDSAPDTTGLKPRIRFFFHLGFAINRWAIIDRELFEIFRILLGSNQDNKAAYLFYKPTSISDHFQMTDTLVKLSASPKRLHRWETIQSKFNTLMTFRNRLAHDPATQIVTAVGRSGSTQEARTQAPEPKWELYIEKFKLLRPKSPNSKNKDDAPITVDRIIQHTSDVEALIESVQTFRQGLPKRLRKRQPAHSSQATSPKSGSKRKMPRSHPAKQSQPQPSSE